MPYVFRKPDPNKSEGVNLHIFRAVRNDEGNFSKKSDSLCKAVAWGKAGNVIRSKNNEDETRTLAAELQNKNIEICGNCVKSLYKDGV